MCGTVDGAGTDAAAGAQTSVVAVTHDVELQTAAAIAAVWLYSPGANPRPRTVTLPPPLSARFALTAETAGASKLKRSEPVPTSLDTVSCTVSSSDAIVGSMQTYTVMAQIVMADIIMAYIVMAIVGSMQTIDVSDFHSLHLQCAFDKCAVSVGSDVAKFWPISVIVAITT